MRVLIVGTGLMGSSIATCLSKKNYNIIAYNRTYSKAVELCKNIGCEAIKDLEGVETDYTLISLFDDQANLKVLVVDKFYERVKTKFIINTSTISPRVSQIIASVFTPRAIKYYEGTVYGSVDEARECRLISMIGGSPEDLNDVERFVREYSSKVVYAGEIPSATALKLAVNNVALALPALIGESLELLEAYNVDVKKLLEVADATWLKTVFERYWGRIIQEKQARFTVAGVAKDFRLIFNELAENGYPAFVSGGVASYYSSLLREYGDKDYPRAAVGYLRKKLSDNKY
ncbi:NAD(P)-dependent oxidoreductase [Thermogladius sp. 4427co]|uniref:NAD(P)-dependent oxidoreductase n=1 Tax=Thermogladius sp. 4427co TaxID=3450718 RepID=UPI003F7B18F4